jgi:hypothetical protein
LDGKFTSRVARRVQETQKKHGTPYVRIYTVGFADRSGERLLREIAEKNGGKYRFVDAP